MIQAAASPTPSPSGRDGFDALCVSIAAIEDPEIPVLTIADLGVLRSIDKLGHQVIVTITPTYSGCPAMQYIEDSITQRLDDAGVAGEVRSVFSPAWTTDDMTETGRAKLAAYGIAPPGAVGTEPLTIRQSIRCPQCDSANTAPISEFGSTACKALYRCLSCQEPFDYFKEI